MNFKVKAPVAVWEMCPFRRCFSMWVHVSHQVLSFLQGTTVIGSLSGAESLFFLLLLLLWKTLDSISSSNTRAEPTRSRRLRLSSVSRAFSLNVWKVISSRRLDSVVCHFPASLFRWPPALCSRRNWGLISLGAEAQWLHANAAAAPPFNRMTAPHD